MLLDITRVYEAIEEEMEDSGGGEGSGDASSTSEADPYRFSCRNAFTEAI